MDEDGAELPSGLQWVDKCSKKSALHAAAQYGQNEVPNDPTFVSDVSDTLAGGGVAGAGP